MLGAYVCGVAVRHRVEQWKEKGWSGGRGVCVSWETSHSAPLVFLHGPLSHCSIVGMGGWRFLVVFGIAVALYFLLVHHLYCFMRINFQSVSSC